MKRKHNGRPLGMAGQPWSPHDRALLNRYMPASKGALVRCPAVARVLWAAAITATLPPDDAVRGPRARTARPKRQIGKEMASTRKNRRARNTRKGGR